ncbi:hypothetical protein ACLHIM_05245 [Ligilactobacillus sp. LYQ112]|uniref:hypothetical protein n=1 Tax=Ligilactobacillus sp. LYQ112 TaxID=3391060 RepID=UPI00398356A9
MEQVRNITAFMRKNLSTGVITVDNIMLDFSAVDHKCVFLKNLAKQILNGQTWYTGVYFQFNDDRDVREAILANYQKIANWLHTVDTMVVNRELTENADPTTTNETKWLRITDHVSMKLIREPIAAD